MIKRHTDRNPRRYCGIGRNNSAWKKLQQIEDLEEQYGESIFDLVNKPLKQKYLEDLDKDLDRHLKRLEEQEMAINELNKSFAEIMIIDKKPDFVGDYLIRVTEKWGCDAREKWSDFMCDNLYDIYQKYGFTRVMMVSKEAFKMFLEWAIPKYRKEVLKNEKEEN
jgi:hypothetical protein